MDNPSKKDSLAFNWPTGWADYESTVPGAPLPQEELDRRMLVWVEQVVRERQRTLQALMEAIRVDPLSLAKERDAWLAFRARLFPKPPYDD